jgi:hypothetical protein
LGWRVHLSSTLFALGFRKPVVPDNEVIEMEKRITIVLIMIVSIVVITVAVLSWSQAPKIPSECSEAYAYDATCFGCHEQGENDAPRIPSNHQEKIEDGHITDDMDSCLKCHTQEE